MTSDYFKRVGLVILIIATMLVGTVWLTRGKHGISDHERYEFYRIGVMDYGSLNLATELVFMRVNSPSSVDDLAFLPGSLAFLPKKARPLFGQQESTPDSLVDMILEPEKCLLVRKVLLTVPRVGGAASGPRVLLTLDEASRRTTPTAGLRAASMPAQCAAGFAPECVISVWAEARPKKCD